MDPLTIGLKITLEIRKQGINGEGIGYYNRLTIFVPGAILKETVICEIIELKQTYAIAKLLEIVRISKRRILPLCKFYDQCGGCQMQHIDYKEQLKIKQQILYQALSRYTDLDLKQPFIQRTLATNNSFHYRNKSQMPFKNTNFGLALGLYRPGSNHFVYVDECPVQDESVNLINQAVLSLLRKHQVLANDSVNPEGILLNLVTRYLESTVSASVTFIITRTDPVLSIIAKELMKKLPIVKSVTYSVNTKANPMMFGKTTQLLAGTPSISDHFQGMKIKISPDAFMQLNTAEMAVLYQEVVAKAALVGDETIIDCYSGIGLTSLILAKQAKKVIGIDYSEASIRDAKDNARVNKITNVEFLEGHVESVLPKLLVEKKRPDLIILDPPRAGLDKKVIKAIIDSKIPKMIYVSCNPSTLAKNLKEFLPVYDLMSIRPLDMFPQTSNVESISLLTIGKTRGKA
ncbi:MAG: 23S rRNA (uracil(1939)-C(5))-methyltransferase RlmD [Acholeplasmataceae bacterium]|nr:23S rRNA (uracil(1939)-C(5))-methyltransferase RlmD [Acholeplasmataceae bacterium]